MSTSGPKYIPCSYMEHLGNNASQYQWLDALLVHQEVQKLAFSERHEIGVFVSRKARSNTFAAAASSVQLKYMRPNVCARC